MIVFSDRLIVMYILAFEKNRREKKSWLERRDINNENRKFGILEKKGGNGEERSTVPIHY